MQRNFGVLLCRSVLLTTLSFNRPLKSKFNKDSECINQFVQLTNCDKQLAHKYLSRNQWRINYALNDFYDQEIGNFHTVCETNEPEVYPDSLIELFNRYSETSQVKDTIDFEGMSLFINDLHLQIDDVVTIVLAKILEWGNLHKLITEEQFLSHWFMQGCSSLKEMELLVQDKKVKLYDNTEYFLQVYNYTFPLILDADKKQLDVETAIEYWQIFFQRPYPIVVHKELLTQWFNFLQSSQNSNDSSNMINLDCWTMLPKFFQKFPTFKAIHETYDEIDPWPYIIDDFIEYLQEQGKIP